jgi:hypothetical protein
MPNDRLPPFPDYIALAGTLDQAVAFLRGLQLPSRIAADHLTRWGQVRGVELTRDDYARVRADLPHRPAE